MKYSLLAGVAAVALAAVQPALAADLATSLPVKAAPAPVVPAFSWTGCYVGAHGGYAWGRERWYNTLGVAVPGAEHDVKGWLAGGQAGCNLQQDRWVFGVEGDLSWANGKGNSFFDSFRGTPTRFGYNTKADILGTIAARLGIAFDRTLLYAKGGLTSAHERHWTTLQILAPLPGPTNIFRETDTNWRWGGMVGGGVEYALTNNWSGKIEYNYLFLGKHADKFCLASNPASCIDLDVKQNIHLVKAVINYRWGPGAVVARY
jgi:outer membrane immunogenic protein